MVETNIEIIWIPKNLKKKYKNMVKILLYKISNIMNDTEYFACIYWSYANWTCTDKSDIDIMVWTKKFTKEKYEKLEKLVMSFHINNSLWIDNEVPLKNKLLIEYSEILRASNLWWLYNWNKNDIIIPKIVKSKHFLESKDIVLRLIFFILTSPIIYIWNNLNLLYEYKAKAEEKLFTLSLLLNKKDDNCFTISNLLNNLLFSKTWETGELFLWYKQEYKLLIKYLLDILRKQLNLFITKWYINKIWSKYYFFKNINYLN
jgi:hypothetical protein